MTKERLKEIRDWALSHGHLSTGLPTYAEIIDLIDTVDITASEFKAEESSGCAGCPNQGNCCE